MREYLAFKQGDSEAGEVWNYRHHRPVQSGRVEGVFPEKLQGVAIDTRQLQPGDIFICYRDAKGWMKDRHAFVKEAEAKGAAGFIAVDPIATSLPVFYVAEEDLMAWTADIASFAQQEAVQRLHVTGITGTNGKTTTAQWAHIFLSAAPVPTGVMGNLGAFYAGMKKESSLNTMDPVTMHETFRGMAHRGVSSVVLEASSQGLEFGRLEGVPMDVAVLTNVTEDHLDYHGSREEYIRAKKRLFSDQLKASGTALLPYAYRAEWEQAFSHRMDGSILTYGQEPEADISANILRQHRLGTDIEVSWKGQVETVTLPVPGEFNVDNWLAAAAIALLHGVTLQAILEKTQQLKPVEGRLDIISTPLPFTCMVDYAHTSDGLERVLETMRPYTEKNLWVVFGCGGDRDATKRPEMGRIAERLADKVVVTSDNPRTESPETIIEEVLAGCERPVITLEDRTKAITHALLHAEEGDIVLVAGKGHETTQIIGEQTFPHHDKSVIEEVAQFRRKAEQGLGYHQ